MSYRGGGGFGGRGGGGGGGGGRGRAGGRKGGGRGLGPSGICKCIKCGKEVPHQPGMPCNQTICPECGISMMRGAPNQNFSRDMQLSPQNTKTSRLSSPNAQNNTQPVGPPIVDFNKCNGCGECVNQCPSGAISIIDNIAVIDLSGCRNCRTCQTVCPEKAIH